jgi:succinate dehydrogenase/fumarate reductase flavoprotein subunit
MLYPPYPNGSRLINDRGEDIVRKHGIDNLGEAMRKKRDSMSALLFRETLEGRVFMDFRQVPAAAWDRYPLTLLRRMKFDFKNRPCAVTPGTHFFMGGVRIDDESRTAQPGLFACGEVAWGLHGANRRGGNALTECVVFGRIAGRNAARDATSEPPAAADLPGPPAGGPIAPSAGSLPLDALRRRMQEVAWQSAGVVRSEKGLREGLEKIAELEAHLRGFAPTSLVEKKLRAHLAGGLFTVKAVLTASCGRHETRGAFIRDDCPAEDPPERAQNSCLTYDPDRGTFRLQHHAVAQPEPA